MNSKMNSDRVTKIAIDGLDGSGKGSIAAEIARMKSKAGVNVLIVDFPQYSPPWGKALRFLLKQDDMGLNLEERMAVYALNRLEAVDAIRSEVQHLLEQDSKPVYILFDRFPTSNTLTLAYYLLKNQMKDFEISDFESFVDFLQQNGIDVFEYFRIMKQMDSGFHELLSTEDATVFVPQIDPNITIQRIQGDVTRDGSDSYENEKVQRIADYLYQIGSQNPETNIKIIYQNNRTPEEIALDILEEVSGSDEAEVGQEVGRIVELKLENLGELPQEVQSAMSQIFELYPRLENLLNEISEVSPDLKLSNNLMLNSF